MSGLPTPTSAPAPAGHARWVRVSHWIVTLSFVLLAFTGVEILMVHPRLYWGEVGNDLTRPWIELPISRNYKHNGYDARVPMFGDANAPVSAGRTYDIFNQNGWGRSLHFLAGWLLVISGVIYLLVGLAGGHFRRHIVPKPSEASPSLFWRDVMDHVRGRIPPASGGPNYGLLQKTSYAVIVFGALPLIFLTGVTMAPAITATFPFLLTLFGGYQSARTIHFLSFAALIAFLVVHIVMTVKSGFRRHMRAMTVGEQS